MANFYLKSGSGVTERANSTTYSLGNRIVPLRADVAGNAAIAKRWIWECTTAGTTGAAVPTWPASVTQDVTTVNDNGLIWTARKPGFSSGTTANWSFATIFMDYAASALGAGDTLYCSNNHSENTTGANCIIRFANSTVAAPNIMLSVSDATTTPTAVTPGAEVITTGNYEIQIGGGVYAKGIKFKAGMSGTFAIGILLSAYDSSVNQVLENCELHLLSSNSGSRLSLHQGNMAIDSVTTLLNCGFYFANVSHRISNAYAGCKIVGGEILTGSAAIPGIFANTFNNILIENFDMSGGATSISFLDVNTVCYLVARNCKTPISWTGGASMLSFTAPIKVEMYNCGPTNDPNKFLIASHHGTFSSENTVIRSNGASNGSSPSSFKLVSLPAVAYPSNTLNTSEILYWNNVVGTPITVSVEILTNGVTLTDAECWVEVGYYGSSSSPILSYISDVKADIFTGPTNQEASTATWVSAPGTPVTQKLSVTFTPQQKGFISAVVKLAKPSTTVYVCPKLEVS